MHEGECTKKKKKEKEKEEEEDMRPIAPHHAVPSSFSKMTSKVPCDVGFGAFPSQRRVKRVKG